jgi:hypothetical protein
VKREVDLVAEPGERVEYLMGESWTSGTVSDVWTIWAKDAAFNRYTVIRPNGTPIHFGDNAIRKPQAAPEQQ